MSTKILFHTADIIGRTEEMLRLVDAHHNDPVKQIAEVVPLFNERGQQTVELRRTLLHHARLPLAAKAYSREYIDKINLDDRVLGDV